jgi:glutathionyl-hydroquinone reductase
MGLLIGGIWHQHDVRIGDDNDKGEFRRKPVTFRNTIENDSKFEPGADRYHLYVSYACPWAHRTLIMRALKGLESVISVDVVSPDMLDAGWSFKKDFDDLPVDNLFNVDNLRDIYLKADSTFTGRVTVPVLWDKKEQTIVNNESSEIIRIFNTQFDDMTKIKTDYYPANLQNEIDEWNTLIYENINNGVYKCGFARSQTAYEEAFTSLFNALDKVEKRLLESEFVAGPQITEADIRLFTTLVRFDSVYHTHFKCNGRLIEQYEGMSRLVKQIRAIDGVEETINMEHIKRHYYYSHTSINPSGIIALGPK